MLIRQLKNLHESDWFLAMQLYPLLYSILQKVQSTDQINFLYPMIIQESYNLLVQLTTKITRQKKKHKIASRLFGLGMISMPFLFITRYIFVNCTRIHTYFNSTLLIQRFHKKYRW